MNHQPFLRSVVVEKAVFIIYCGGRCPVAVNLHSRLTSRCPIHPDTNHSVEPCCIGDRTYINPKGGA